MKILFGVSRFNIALLILFAACQSTSSIPGKTAPIQEMARFANCDFETKSLIDLDRCAREKITAYLNEKIKKFANQYNLNKFTDDFYLTFVVQGNGEIIDVEAHEGTDKDLQQVMIQIFEGMDKWVPAQDKNGNKARVRLAFPLVIVQGKVHI